MAHGFSKEKLKTVESQLSDASREQDPTCNGMARHGCVFGWCRPMILKGTGFDLKAISVPFLSMFRLYLCQTFIASPFMEKRAIYILYLFTSVTVSEQGGRQVHPILRHRRRSKDCWKSLQRIHLQTQKLRCGMQIRMLYIDVCFLVNYKFRQIQVHRQA